MIRAEALNAETYQRDRRALLACLDERGLRGTPVRLGETTGYKQRNMLGDRKALRAAETEWRTPEAGTALDAAWRSTCQAGLQGTLPDLRLEGGAVGQSAGDPDPRHIRSETRPQRRRLGPSAAATPGGGTVVQVGASKSEADARALHRRPARQSGRPPGLGRDGAGRRPRPGGASLVGGSRTRPTRARFCAGLKAAGRGCLCARREPGDARRSSSRCAEFGPLTVGKQEAGSKRSMSDAPPVPRTCAAVLDGSAYLGAGRRSSAVGAGLWFAAGLREDLGRAAPIWVGERAALLCGGARAADRAAGGFGWLAASSATSPPTSRSTTPSRPPVALAGATRGGGGDQRPGSRRVLPGGFHPGWMGHLALGVGFAVAGAAASAVMASAWLGLLGGRHALDQLVIWTCADTLGLMIITPCLLILADWRLRIGERPPTPGPPGVVGRRCWRWKRACSRRPLSAAVPGGAAAVVAAINLEMIGAAIVVLATAALAVGFTFVGRGPIALEASGRTRR